MTSSQTVPIHAYTHMQSSGERLQRQAKLQASTYDGAVLAAIALVDEEYLKVHAFSEAVFQFAFAWVINGLNTVSQLLLVYMLYVSVIERQESLFENDPMRMIEEIKQHLRADNRHPLSPHNATEADILLRCSADETLPYAHMLVVCLWFSRMLIEVVDSILYARIIWHLPVPVMKGQVMEVSNVLDDRENIVEYKYFIVALPRFMKVIITCAITGLRVVVAFCLTWTSARYLIMSNDMAHVLLKAVGLQFVVGLDELLFKSFCPGIFRRQVEHTRFVFPGTIKSLWQQWMGSAWKVAGVLALGIVMSRFVFYKVHAFRSQCREYYEFFPPTDVRGAAVWSKGPLAPLTEMFEFMMTT